MLDALFSHLTAWLAPILCFTAEEAWLSRRGEGDAESVHLRTFPAVPADWRDDALAAKWEKIRGLRRVVTGALEIERAEKRIGSSLQAAPTVSAETVAAMAGLDLAEISITSGGTLVEGEVPAAAFRLPEVDTIGIEPGLADGEKCARCWQVLPDVGTHAHPDVCGRCAAAVDRRQEAAE